MSAPVIDVAIIGGGISGLAVANGVQNAGFTVQLFEARSRLGGRIHSVPVAGGIAEMGATWFWDNEPRVQALIEAFDIATHDQWEAGDALVAANGQVVRYSRPWSTNSRRFTGGASQLVDGLAKNLPKGVVHINSPAKRVERTDELLEIHLIETSVRARQVVIALPPSLAVANRIIDEADLEPRLREAAGQVAVWMGTSVKALAIYDKPFWRADGLSGSASSQVDPLHEIHDISGPEGSPGILFGFGQTMPETVNFDEEPVIEQLCKLFGPAANDPVEVLVKDWRQDPYTTPAIWPPNDRYDLFGSPVLQRPAWDGKLFWSSTETASFAPGHIEGALEAAERTTAAIVNYLTPT